MHPPQYLGLKLQQALEEADFPTLLVPVRFAFRAIGVGPTKGYELVAAGHLTLVKIGSKSLITAESLHRFTASLAPASASVGP